MSRRRAGAAGCRRVTPGSQLALKLSSTASSHHRDVETLELRHRRHCRGQGRGGTTRSARSTGRRPPLSGRFAANAHGGGSVQVLAPPSSSLGSAHGVGLGEPPDPSALRRPLLPRLVGRLTRSARRLLCIRAGPGLSRPSRPGPTVRAIPGPSLTALSASTATPPNRVRPVRNCVRSHHAIPMPPYRSRGPVMATKTLCRVHGPNAPLSPLQDPSSQLAQPSRLPSVDSGLTDVVGQLPGVARLPDQQPIALARLPQGTYIHSGPVVDPWSLGSVPGTAPHPGAFLNPGRQPVPSLVAVPCPSKPTAFHCV